MNTRFSGFGNKYKTGYTNKVTQVYQVLHYFIEKRFIFCEANIILAYIQLYNAFTVLYFYKKTLPLSLMLMIRPARQTLANCSLFPR